MLTRYEFETLRVRQANPAPLSGLLPKKQGLRWAR